MNTVHLVVYLGSLCGNTSAMGRLMKNKNLTVALCQSAVEIQFSKLKKQRAVVPKKPGNTHVYIIISYNFYYLHFMLYYIFITYFLHIYYIFTMLNILYFIIIHI